MTTPYRLQPSSGNETELRRPVEPGDMTLPVLSVASLAPAGRVRLGEAEFVTYTGFGVDMVGQPTLTGCTRGAAREQGGSEPRAWRGGTRVVQAPYEKPELVSAIPDATIDQAGRQVYLDEPEPELSFYAESGSASSQRDLTTPDQWNAPYLGQWGGEGLSNGQFGDLRGIAWSSEDGYVYVSSDNRIQRFSANGTFDSVIATAGSSTGQVNTPWALSVARTPTAEWLMIADTGNNRYQYRRIATGTTSAVSSLGGFTFNAPRGVLWPFKSGVFSSTYLADTGNNRIFSSIPSAGILSGDAGFVEPGPIYMDRTDNTLLYVVEPTQDRIRLIKVALTGHTFATRAVIGSPGSAAGQLKSPQGLATDRQGNLYVADTLNHRVQVFDRAGVFRGLFGRYGSGDGEFNLPTAIEITDDYLYVTDSGNHRVQIFRNPLAGTSFIVGEWDGTWDPPSLGVGGSTRLSGVEIPGALPGDLVQVSHTGVGTLTILFTGNVTAPDSVDVYAFNVNATTAQNVPSGTVRVRVTR